MTQSFFLSLLVHCLHAIYIDKPDQFDPSWIKIQRTNLNRSIELLFALKQQNVNALEDTLLKVSNPSDANYGKHLSTTEIHTIVAPSTETINTITKWVISFGINKYNINNKTLNADFISVLTTIKTAENILHCNYYDYYNTKIGSQYTISRLDTNCNYNIPSHIAKHLDFISPTKRFPSTKHIKSPYNYSYPYTDITPPFIQQLYQINNTKGKSPTNKQGIASFSGQYFNTTDIQTFWNQYNITNNINLITKTSNNGTQPSGYSTEASMNTEYMTSIGQSIATEIWYTSDTQYNLIQAEPFLLFLLDVLNSTNPPWLFVISYVDYEFNLGYEYCYRCNIEFAKLGTMGITMLVASGDNGVGDDEQCCNRNPQIFCPMFPASSPYVTTVGGCLGGTIGRNPTGEIAWHPSGGGFSNFFEMQEYQKIAVENFIQLSTDMNQLPDVLLWNQSGRAYPDIAAQSYLCDIIVNDTLIDFSGTGCGVSIVGGIFSLLNDLRFQNNKTSLGWLNPFIYDIALNDALAFNDVTCDCPNNCCNGNGAFHAIDGWDAVTGYGSPNYATLKLYMLSSN